MKDNLLNTENGLESTTISKEEVNNSNLYLDEKDSKGVPLLRRIEKYPDLPEDEFIPIEYPGIDGDRYKINKKGEILNISTGKILIGTKTVKNYIQHSIKDSNNKKRSYRTHRLVGFTFLLNPNSDIYNVVNHIDSNTLNCNLSNLEFVTITTNNNTSKKKIKNKEKDKKGTKDRIEETDKIIGYSGNPSNYIWFKHWKYENIYVCKEGFIARYDSSNKLKRVGSITSENYVRIHYDRKNTSMMSHRIIAEFILNRDLKNWEIVDHINCVRYDNSFENLRITDNIGNMNNPNTLEKYRKKAILTDLCGDFIMYDYCDKIHRFVYKDYTKNGAKLDSKSSVVKLSKNILANKYFCIKIQDKEELLKKMEVVIYVFSDKNKTNLIEAFDSLRDTSRNLHIDRKTIRKIINKNIPDRNGRYYIKGPDAVKLMISLGHGTALNFNLDN